MSERVPCVVPFCRRTGDPAKMPGAAEMICGKCGRRARRRLRLLYRKCWRRWERGERTPAMGARLDRLWTKFKDEAIAAAAAAP